MIRLEKRSVIFETFLFMFEGNFLRLWFLKCRYTLPVFFGEHRRENLDLNIVLISWQPVAYEVSQGIEDMLETTMRDER